MLNQSDISADSQWATVQTQLSNLAAFSAVRSQEARQELFQDYVSNLQVPEQASQLKAAACMLANYRCCFQSQWTLMQIGAGRDYLFPMLLTGSYKHDPDSSHMASTHDCRTALYHCTLSGLLLVPRTLKQKYI